MPLRAVIDRKTIIAPDLTDREWEELKRRHKKGLAIAMGCCGAPGHLRISRKGTRHFYHATDTGCHYEEESKEHLEIKYQVYRACQAAGWEATVEFPAPDRSWIADVYASRDHRKLVFEIQISTISPEELAERDRKYRDAGIEAYWLLDHFLGREKDFAAGYDAHLSGEDELPGKTIPYIDPSLFATGTENQIFIAKGIRSAGLDAKKQTLFSTNNPAIPLAIWVKEVLNGNYGSYLEETAAAFERKRRLKDRAGPALVRFRIFYEKIVRDKTFREKAGRLDRRIRGDAARVDDAALRKKSREIISEIAWLENEYRSCVAESAGLFVWKKVPERDTSRLYFRPETEANVKKLQDCVERFDRWEVSFEHALDALERELMAGKK